MANAGRVAIKPEGEYVKGQAYKRLSLVTYNGKVFIAKKDTADMPTADSADWMFIIETDRAQLDDLAGKLNDIIANGTEKVNGHTVETDVPADAVFTDTTVGQGISCVSLPLVNVNNSDNNGTEEHWNLSRYIFPRDVLLEAGTLYLLNFEQTNNKVDVNIYDKHGNYYVVRKKTNSGWSTKFGTVVYGNYPHENLTGATGEGVLSPSSYYLTIFTGSTFDIMTTY